MGNQWTKLSEFFPGRTENGVKNRFHSAHFRKWCGEKGYKVKIEIRKGEFACCLVRCVTRRVSCKFRTSERVRVTLTSRGHGWVLKVTNAYRYHAKTNI